MHPTSSRSLPKKLRRPKRNRNHSRDMPQLQIFLSQDNRISFDLGEEKVTIGRLAHNVLQIDELSVSSHHADLFLEAGRYHLHDPGSTNGTYVNGEQVTDAILRNGDELRFGSVEGHLPQRCGGLSFPAASGFPGQPRSTPPHQVRGRRISSAYPRLRRTLNQGIQWPQPFTGSPLLPWYPLERRCTSF